MRKFFKHNLVTPIDLQQQSINGTRYYALPNGEKFKSVTTVIGEKTDKTHLNEWRKRIGETEAKKISVQAARRGTAIHTLAERYVLNEENYLEGAMPSNAEMFNNMRGVIDANVDNVLGVELPLFSRALRAAGKSDLIAAYKGVPSIIDFKTARKLKKEEWIENYFVQSSVYAAMFYECYNILIPQIVIIIGVDHEKEPQIFIKSPLQFEKRIYEIFIS